MSKAYRKESTHEVRKFTREEAREQFKRNGSNQQGYDVRYDLITLPDGTKALKRVTTTRVMPAEGVIHGTPQEKEAT